MATATMSQLHHLIGRALRCRYNIELVSPPARGKTFSVTAFVSDQQTRDPDFFYLPIDGGTAAPPDFVMSMPNVAEGTIDTLIHGALPNHYVTPDMKGIIYVGEKALMGLETSKGFQKLWNHETIMCKSGLFAIPAGVIFVADGNRMSDKSGAQQGSRANGSRFQQWDIEYDETYAVSATKTYHYIVAAYLDRYPDQIDNYYDVFESGKFKAGDVTFEEGKRGIWSNLRSWKRVSDSLHDADSTGIALLPSEVAANIGSMAADKFNAYRQMVDSLERLEDIVARPDKARVPSKMDEQWALVSMLALLVSKDHWDAVVKYIVRYPVEMQVIFARLLLQRLNRDKDGPDASYIKRNPAYMKWITSKDIKTVMQGAI